MAVPKRKTTPMKRNQRRSHLALLPTNVQECKSCGELKLPHHICKACGDYNGKIVTATASSSAN